MSVRPWPKALPSPLALLAACGTAGPPRAPAAAPASALERTPSGALAPATAPLAPHAADDPALDQLRRDALALEPLATTKLARDFLAATAAQPHIEPRVAWVDPATRQAWTEAQVAALPSDRRTALQRKELGASYYWETRYGSPLAYVRAMEILARSGVGDVAGKRFVDFGYGTVGPLRLLATLGADAVGVDVDPLLPVLYSQPGDQGPVGGRGGRVTLVSGHWPAFEATRAAVGSRVDVFLSKNTLKRGYVHPALAVPPGRAFDLGVDDAAFVAAVRDALAPRGLVLLYNVCPAPAPPGAPYVPWADGRSPFDRATWLAGGFELLDLDRDDSGPMRAVAHALRWDDGEDKMDIEHDLFVTYTLARKL